MSSCVRTTKSQTPSWISTRSPMKMYPGPSTRAGAAMYEDAPNAPNAPRGGGTVAVLSARVIHRFRRRSSSQFTDDSRSSSSRAFRRPVPYPPHRFVHGGAHRELPHLRQRQPHRAEVDRHVLPPTADHRVDAREALLRQAGERTLHADAEDAFREQIEPVREDERGLERLEKQREPFGGEPPEVPRVLVDREGHHRGDDRDASRPEDPMDLLNG